MIRIDRVSIFMAAVAVSAAAACAGPTGNIKAVSELDLERYDGVWYDVASFPQSFQEGCHCTTATYELKDDGTVGVLNQCRKDSIDGPEDEATGKAYLPDSERPAELKVEFFWPFAGNYWVVYLEDGPDEYQLAVVSEPTQEYLWILSRTPSLSDEKWTELESMLADQGFDLARLERTVQEGCWE